MKLYSYTVRYDHGFAPNPFGKYCTLATCKPGIRRHAQIGDWVMGSGSVATVGGNRLVYAMEVTNILPLEKYFEDSRFQYKKPVLEGTWEERRGDNMYEMVNGKFEQLPSPFHGLDQKDKDTCGRNVLISENFYYFGKDAVEIPKRFRKLIGKRKYKCNVHDPKDVREFIDWLKSDYEKGKHGEPIDREGKCDCEESETASSKKPGCSSC